MYTTEGIVLKRNAFGEANVLFHILTYDLGLIIASAQSARLLSSKLRSSLQEYTHATVAVVKGKNGWKITNAIAKENFFFNYPEFSQKFVSQVSGVLVRMMPGEENNPDVFRVVLSGFKNLNNFQEKYISSFECLMMLRILYNLGYVSRDEQTEKFLVSGEEWGVVVLDEVILVKKYLIEKINKGLKESQL